MNRQTLSFTYNFDTSHLNNNDNQDNGKNERNVSSTTSSNLGNSGYLPYLQTSNFNVQPTTSIIPSTPNNNPPNNLFLSTSSFGNLGLSQQFNQIPQSPFNQNMGQIPYILNTPKPTTQHSIPNFNNLNIPNNPNNPILVQPLKQINPLYSTPLTPTPGTPLLSNSMSSAPSSLFTSIQGLGLGLGGLNAESIGEGGGEEADDLKKMNLSQFKELIPVDSKDKKDEEEEDDYTNYDYKEPTLQNVISTFNLNCKLDLAKIQKKARNTEYHPKRFAALVMRIKDPQTTALIFSSGKVVVTGAKNESESKLACKKFARIIKKLDFPASFKDFKIQNIVASCEVGFKVSLETLVASEHQNSCRFEPELFPGLIYKMIEPKVTLLIFVSGKIVITGAKNKKNVDDAFKNISPVLLNFKKDKN